MRIDRTFSAEENEIIGRQYKALFQPDVKGYIDSFDDDAAYHNAWIGLHKTYTLLERFDGGLATIFQEHSSFRATKYEKNKN